MRPSDGNKYVRFVRAWGLSAVYVREVRYKSSEKQLRGYTTEKG
jgi:hypothetical protein